MRAASKTLEADATRAASPPCYFACRHSGESDEAGVLKRREAEVQKLNCGAAMRRESGEAVLR